MIKCMELIWIRRNFIANIFVNKVQTLIFKWNTYIYKQKFYKIIGIE